MELQGTPVLYLLGSEKQSHKVKVEVQKHYQQNLLKYQK